MTPATLQRELTENELRARLARLADSPAIDEILAKEQAKLEARRTQAAAAIRAIDARVSKELPKATAAYDKADKAFKDALEAYRQAEETRRQAYYFKQHVANASELEKRPFEQTLRDTADPSIHALEVELSKNYPAKSRSEYPNGRMPDAEHAVVVALSERRLAAIKETAELWREPLSHDELAARIARIRRECGL